MKTYILSFLFILVSATGFAQTNDKVFYSIDAKEWKTESERNSHELDLHAEMVNNLITIVADDLGTGDECMAVSDFLDLFYELLDATREANKSIENFMTPYYVDLFKKQGLVIKPKRAINNELFRAEEIADLISVHIDQYWFYREWVQAKLQSKDYTSPLDPDFVAYSKKKMEDATVRYKKMANKVASINENFIAIVVADKASKASANASTSASKKSSLAEKGYLFYSLDGREYKTKRGRNNRNELLRKKTIEILDEMDKDSRVKDETSDLLRKVLLAPFDNVKAMAEWVDPFDNGGNYDIFYEKFKRDCPEAEFGIYQAKNKEVFFLKEMAEVYNCLLSMYNIGDGLLSEIKKGMDENKKLKEGEITARITFVLNLEDQKDADGQNIVSLTDKLVELMDKVELKMKMLKQ